MAVAEQAALLDELMGKGRNASLGEARESHWSDEDNCKLFLAGLCPHELFNNTKDDIGPCEKVHDDALLEKYRKSERRGEMKYEEKLCIFLKELLSTVEARIRRGESRLLRNGAMVHSFYNCEREEELEKLNFKIDEALCKVEKLGTEGEVQQSRTWFDVAEQLKTEKNRIEKSIDIYNQQAKELEICQTCGAFQVKGDAHQRVEEHLQGKMHLGYAQIRLFLAELAAEKEKKVKEEKWNKSQVLERNKINDVNHNDKSKEKLKDKDRQKDEEREKVKDRVKDKEREKFKKRETDKEREKKRKRKRSSSNERHHSSKQSRNRRSDEREKHSSSHYQSKSRHKSPKKDRGRR